MEALHIESTSQKALDLPPDPRRTWGLFAAGLALVLAGTVGSIIKAAFSMPFTSIPNLSPTPLHLSLVAFGILILGQCLASPGLWRGALAGSVITLFLLYPVHRAFVIAVNSPGCTLPGLEPAALACLAGALLALVVWFAGRPTSPIDGFLGGFLCGGIPASLVGLPYLDSVAITPLFTGVVSLPAPQLGDNLSAVLLTLGRLSVGALPLLLLPLLTGWLGTLRPADPAAAAAPAPRLQAGPATFLTVLCFLAIAMEIITVTTLAPSLKSMLFYGPAMGTVPELPLGLSLWASLVPPLGLLFLGWSTFFAWRAHLDRGGRILAFLTSAILIVSAAIGLLLSPPNLQWLFLGNGLLGLVLWLVLGPPVPDPEQGAAFTRPPLEIAMGRHSLLGGVGFTLLIGPLVNNALAIGIIFIPLISYCSVGMGGKSIDELRAMTGFGDIWPFLSAMAGSLFLVGAALGAVTHFFQDWVSRPPSSANGTNSRLREI